MAKIDIEFSKILKTVLTQGIEYNNDRRNVKRLQIPSYTFRHEFSDGFPALTLKKLAFKSVITELIWFLKGDNNIKFLNENHCKIWNKDAYNWHVKNEETPLHEDIFNDLGQGSVGQNYSVQWRNFGGKVDQISNLIRDMKADIMGSRLIVQAWNPLELDKTALPPCHSQFQIIGVPLGDGNFGFELHWYQRSNDVFLGNPYNIASYATLALILEKITGYKALAIQADMKCVHLYENQIEAAKEIITRDCLKFEKCELEIKDFENFENLLPGDFKLVNYDSFQAIKVEMVAPTSI